MHWIIVLSLVIAVALAVGGVWSVRRWPEVLHPSQLTTLTRRNLRRIWILLAGSTIILVGVLIAPLPGPGFILLGPLGLALLATEFAWARRLRDQVKSHSTGVQTQIDRLAARTALWAVPFVWISYWAAIALILQIDQIPRWLVWPPACFGFTFIVIVSWRTYTRCRNAARDRKQEQGCPDSTRDAA